MKVTLKVDLEKVSEDFRFELAQITKDKALLDILAEDVSEGVRAAVIDNKKTTQKTRRKFLNDECVDVRIWCARSKFTGKKILKEMIKDENQEVKDNARANLYGRK